MKFKLALFLLVIISVRFSQAQSGSSSKSIFEFEKKHKFSSESTLDIFKLTVRGDNIVDGIVTFQILNASRKEIYSVRFTVGQLMEFGPDEKDKESRRNKKDSLIITEVLKQFFDERNFRKPAVQDTSEREDNLSSYENWSLIKQDVTSTGFHYSLGAEVGRSIAYSKKKKKVILYFTCC